LARRGHIYLAYGSAARQWRSAHGSRIMPPTADTQTAILLTLK
jgi:hypothetical protein